MFAAQGNTAVARRQKIEVLITEDHGIYGPKSDTGMLARRFRCRH